MPPKRKAEDDGDDSKMPPTKKPRPDENADSDSEPVTRDKVAEMEKDLVERLKDLSAAKKNLADARRSCNKNEPKEKRTRRKKDEDEPDYEQLTLDRLRAERAKKGKGDKDEGGRTPQSCIRCNLRKMRCSAGPDPCSNCLLSNHVCKMLDKSSWSFYERGELQKLREDNERLRSERNFYMEGHMAAGGRPLASHPSPTTESALLPPAETQQAPSENNLVNSEGQIQDQNPMGLIDNGGPSSGAPEPLMQSQQIGPEAQQDPSQFPQASNVQGPPHYQQNQQYHGGHYAQPPQNQYNQGGPQYQQPQQQYFENPFDQPSQSQDNQQNQGYASLDQIHQPTWEDVGTLQQQRGGQQHPQYRSYPEFPQPPPQTYRQQQPPEDLPQHIDPSMLMRQPGYSTEAYPEQPPMPGTTPQTSARVARSQTHQAHHPVEGGYDAGQENLGHDNTQDQELNDEDLQMAICLSHETARSQEQDSNFVLPESLDRDLEFDGA